MIYERFLVNPRISPRIALNVRALSTGRGGIGRYVAELAAGLPHLCQLLCFDGRRWTVGPPTVARPDTPTPTWRRLAPAVPGARALLGSARAWSFRRGVARLVPQLYHEPAFLPFRFAGPTIVTVHDLSWLHFAHLHPPDRARDLAQRMPRIMASAHRILTDSQFVAEEICAHFPDAAQRVRVTHLGVDGGFCPATPEATYGTLSGLGLQHGAYVLAVGTLEPRKNLATLVRAYADLPLGLRQRFPLAIAGDRGWGEPLSGLPLERLRREACFKLLGYVPEPHLPALYAGAATFVYPSLYEGFGLPPLEAMACGAPVIVSDRGSLPEVTGNAAVQVPALDVDALRLALQALLENAPARAALATAGSLHARTFTWEACIERTFAVYRELLP